MPYSPANALLELYTDGACKGNPGPGGWGVFLENPSNKQADILYGYQQETTNNRMELMAVIQGLDFLLQSQHSPGTVAIFSDSQYVIKGVTLWSIQWQKNHWQTSKKSPVENQEYWKKILSLHTILSEKNFSLQWHWIKGHSHHPKNHYVDALAKRAIVEKLDFFKQSIETPFSIPTSS